MNIVIFLLFLIKISNEKKSTYPVFVNGLIYKKYKFLTKFGCEVGLCN